MNEQILTFLLLETPHEDTAEKNEVFGTYRPYFHGELVAEYRNSISRASKAKAPTNGQTIKAIEAEEPVEEYQEPGEKIDEKIDKTKRFLHRFSLFYRKYFLVAGSIDLHEDMVVFPLATPLLALYHST